MDTKSYYEKVYNQEIDINNLKKLKSITPFKQIKKNLFLKYAKGNNILEIGCGFGEYLSLFNNGLYGTDISINALKKAKIFCPKAVFFQANGEKLPIKNEIFDCILLPDIIEHIENDQDLFKEVHRILKNNGRILIISHFSGGSKTKENEDILWTNVIGEGGDIRQYGFDLIDKLESIGFKKIEFRFLYNPITALLTELKMKFLKKKGMSRKNLLNGTFIEKTKNVNFYSKILYLLYKLDYILFSKIKGRFFFLVMEKIS